MKQKQALQMIEVRQGFLMPAPFANKWTEIQKTELPFININVTPAVDAPITGSKLGGFPCLPIGFPYPTDEDGGYLYPLAQINCAQLPPAMGYPETGYLQFYIGTDDLLGVNFENHRNQTNFRVLYFEEQEVAAHRKDFDFIKETMENDRVPMHKTFELKFTKEIEYIGINDYRYLENPSPDLQKIVDSHKAFANELEDYIADTFMSSGHKMGGYACFTQYDIREGNKDLQGYELLLQIDSDDDIMWGDVGVANFFIHPTDLAKKDFTKVAYSWDCY